MDLITPVCDDRITILPADVIHRILLFLPLKAAARTALLSTQWRSHWRRIPQLVFFNDFRIAPNDESMMKTLIFNICRVLLLHDGPIEKFTLAVPGLRSAPCESEIGQIILHLSNRDVKTFQLVFYVRDNQVYKLHSALFSCHQLNALDLRYCEFRQPSWFVGFGKLNILHMCQVILPTDFFENFLGKCPNLQTLLVKDCVGPSNIEVVAPRLQIFTFYGYLLQICFKHAPLLQSLVIDLHVRGQGVEKPVVDTAALFASLPALQQFRLDFQLLQYFAPGNHVSAPIRLPAPLHRIQSVNIRSVDLGSWEKAFAFACLIMSFPNLLYLTIQLEASQQN
ncbi:unnamed protein product [Linum trigynum]|uniref:F-box domain-containing protein n=1 Tax=Linum trigynum TaxID=586398 RepID=A0AAV2GCJ5_9ROSI